MTQLVNLEETGVVVPSSTARGAAWLANFDLQERDTARLLLDSLTFASHDTVRAGLLDALNRHARHPTVLVPLQDLNDITPFSAWDSTKGRDTLVAYTDFDPGAPISVTPGSEGAIGNLVRDLILGVSSQTWIHPTSSLDHLRELKVRSLIFVTDYLGSGQQASRYVRAFLRNSTIRSWRSSGHLEVTVLAYAASRYALASLGSLVTIDSVRIAPSFDGMDWDVGTRSRVEDLCRAYSKNRKQALGYKDSAGLFVSSLSSVPNNVPMILRQRTRGWNPFFDGRTVPTSLVREVGDYAPTADLAAVIRATGQTRLANTVAAGQHSTPGAEILSVLALLYATPGESVTAVSELLRLKVPQVQNILDFLFNSGLISSDRRLLAPGLAEMRASKRLRRSAPVVPTSTMHDPYYPQHLR